MGSASFWGVVLQGVIVKRKDAPHRNPLGIPDNVPSHRRVSVHIMNCADTGHVWLSGMLPFTLDHCSL